MFLEALVTIAKRWKNSKCLSLDEWINTMCFIHTMEYYSFVKRNKVPIDATT